MLIHGLQPGPALFLEQPELISSLFLLFVLGNLFFFVIGLAGLPVLLKILETRPRYLLPIVVALCLIGSYASSASLFDAWLALGFGAFGFFMRKLCIPIAPMVLGFILGPLIEDNLRRAIILDDGDIAGFQDHPISILALGGIGVLIVLPHLAKLGKRLLEKRDLGN